MISYSLLRYDTTKVAKFRMKVIKFHSEFGTKAALAAFPVSRSTIFAWKKRFKEGKGRLSCLIPKSTRPKQVRKMIVNPLVVSKIKSLRQKHYRLGKQKLKPLLDDFCREKGLKPLSTSAIGKVIKRYNMFYQRPNLGYHDPARKKHQFKKKIRIKKSPKPKTSGWIQGDTIETITADGLRRYTISFIDVKLKISYSKTFTGKLSKYSLECFKEFEKLLGDKVRVRIVQTDNGSEFLGVFDNYLRKKEIKHLWTYPGCPKVNSYIERYNRSIQEEWMKSYLDEIADVKIFNKRLRQYLNFYNNKRVHEGLNLKTPAQVIGKELKSPECI